MDRVLFQREGPLYLSLPRVIRHDGRVVPGPFGLDEGGGLCIEGGENGSSFTTNTGDLFEDIVKSARDADLQVNVLVVDTADLTDEQIADLMEEQIAKGSTAIIADEPAILADVLAAHPPPCP